MTDRIYVVTDTVTGETTLVEATSQSHALRRITAPRFTVAVAKPADMLSAIGGGAKVLTRDIAESSHDGSQ